ncbi:MAG TPA: hypothetical protein PKX87_04410, partial [Alphaproteobacteria bacterium]|nr:hypothetical protein [Alphaproteobacteria bacterium]
MDAEAWKSSLTDLVEQSKILLSGHKSVRKEDLVGRLITYFMFKQLDHAMSVLKLDPSMDMVLISRTMI